MTHDTNLGGTCLKIESHVNKNSKKKEKGPGDKKYVKLGPGLIPASTSLNTKGMSWGQFLNRHIFWSDITRWALFEPEGRPHKALPTSYLGSSCSPEMRRNNGKQPIAGADPRKNPGLLHYRETCGGAKQATTRDNDMRRRQAEPQVALPLKQKKT